MYFVLLTVFACLSTFHCFIQKDVKKNESHCGLLKQWLESSLVTMEITKTGFHREVVTTVVLSPGVLSPGVLSPGVLSPGVLSPSVLSGVRVVLVQRWPRGVYVDPYQLASLSEQSNWQILIDSAIDLEVPAHKTEGFVTYVYPALDGPTPRLKVTIPIHGRYHKPSYDGLTFTSVEIEHPELLLRTEKCPQLNNVEPHAVVDAPCTHDNSSMCPWVKLQQQERGPTRVQLPVGDGSLVAPVCGGTLLVTMLCCAALSKHMWEHRIM
ncbi:phosphatidylinositol-glycan biosynthesis class X protein [Pseudoliparis swirei]|uniref:phosphatidylinositol-glycan biosynthesis class X protein n=1 Tax=Pseudoliparis swirei TaxID=2059687 RepID=UPI0024BDF0B7|nr:phosphatidylinositol-glycan biosynthesis class X protein [Pseudoliparis swirei]